MPATQSLTRDEAVRRRGLLDVTSYDLTLDLASDAETFGSRTVIRFRSRGGTTFLDVQPRELRSVVLDGDPLDPGAWDRGRLPVTAGEGDHELVVDAVMGFRSDGEGLHRAVDP